jgi:hypothetical protein
MITMTYQEAVNRWVEGRQCRIWNRWTGLRIQAYLSAMNRVIANSRLSGDSPTRAIMQRQNVENSDLLDRIIQSVINDFIMYASILTPEQVAYEMEYEQCAAEEYMSQFTEIYTDYVARNC